MLDGHKPERKWGKIVAISLAALLGTAVVAAVVMVCIHQATFPKFGEAVAELDKLDNYHSNFSLRIDGLLDGKESNVRMNVASDVDLSKKISFNSYELGMDDVTASGRFMTKKQHGDERLFTEKMDGWEETELDANFHDELMSLLGGLHVGDKAEVEDKFNQVAYRVNLSHDDMLRFMDIYNRYAGFKKEQLTGNGYEMIAKWDHDGHIKQLKIDLTGKINLADGFEVKSAEALLDFSHLNNTEVLDITDAIDKTLGANVKSGDTGKISLARAGGSRLEREERKSDVQNRMLVLNKLEVVAPSDGYYAAGQIIKFKATWSGPVFNRFGKEIKGVNAPNLRISFGGGMRRAAKFVSVSGNVIEYEYKLRKGDEGKIALVDYSGFVFDANGNRSIDTIAKLSGNTEIFAGQEPSAPEEKPSFPGGEDAGSVAPLFPIKPQKPEIEPETEPEDKPEVEPGEGRPSDSGMTSPEKKPIKDVLEMTSEEFAQWAKDSYELIDNVSDALPEIVGQLKELDFDPSCLSLMQIVAYAKEVKRVYGVPKDTGAVEYTRSTQFARMTVYSNGDNKKGPIGITPAILNSNGSEQQVYVVSLGGTEFVDGQATDFSTDSLAGYEYNNDYLKAVYNSVLENVPAGSKLVIHGISLGGMIAQQIAAQQAIKDNYEVVNIISYGSPIVTPELREGETHRLCDLHDIVPIMSVSNNPENVEKYDAVEKHTEDGGYTNFLWAHTFSYIDGTDAWGEYDVLGRKGGDASIKMDLNKTEWYEAPLSK